MCLVVRQKGITPKDVSVWKILLIDDNKLYSPFKRWKYWDLNVINIDKHKDSFKKKNGIIKLGSGYFHSYTNLNFAKNQLHVISKKYKDCRFVLCNAIIPENVQCFSDNNGQICSKSLKIVDVCV